MGTLEALSRAQYTIERLITDGVVLLEDKRLFLQAYSARVRGCLRNDLISFLHLSTSEELRISELAWDLADEDDRIRTRVTKK